jgi:NAD(P)-dependent dehydrogenase (short-subunit alcohol dehydrogenase family)
MEKPLAGQVALVAGATRGAGRGIARALGEAGAFVYCTGRSSAGHPKGMDRPETIDETAALIRQDGGEASAVRVDHTKEAEVEALAARIRGEAGRLDVLVNSIWGADPMVDWASRFWQIDLSRLRAYLDQTVVSHLITNRHLAPLMVEADRGLIVEVIDGHFAGYRGHILYDLTKAGLARLAYGMAMELARTGVTALSVSPDFPKMFDANVRALAAHQPLDEQGRFLAMARYWQIHKDPERRDLAVLLAGALGLEGLGPGLGPAEAGA